MQPVVERMRIGIISDTHDKLARTVAAVELLTSGGAEALIHCGDVTGPEIVRVCGVLPSYFVFGNNDDGDPALRRAIERMGGVCLGWAGEVPLAGKRIAVVHGHLTRDVRRLAAGQPDYLLFGHSHHPTDRRQGRTRWINPGALHRAAKYTVALLEPETDFLQFLAVPR